MKEIFGHNFQAQALLELIVCLVLITILIRLSLQLQFYASRPELRPVFPSWILKGGTRNACFVYSRGLLSLLTDFVYCEHC